MNRIRTLALVAGLAVLFAGSTAQAQEWATIKGTIELKDAPKPAVIAVNNDKAHCESKGPLMTESLIVNPKNNGVKYVVVWLRPDTENRKDLFPAEKIKPELKAASVERVIDQPCCQFEPRVLAARAGDKLVIKNSAPVSHNIKMSADAPAFTFNVNLPAGGSHKPEGGLEAQSSAIPFECNVHTWMKGYLRVFDHPYFAVTDADGKFEIKDAPVGKWRLVIWQEGGFHKGKAGLLGMPIEVKAGGTEVPAVNLELPAATP